MMFRIRSRTLLLIAVVFAASFALVWFAPKAWSAQTPERPPVASAAQFNPAAYCLASRQDPRLRPLCQHFLSVKLRGVRLSATAKRCIVAAGGVVVAGLLANPLTAVLSAAVARTVVAGAGTACLTSVVSDAWAGD